MQLLIRIFDFVNKMRKLFIQTLDSSIDMLHQTAHVLHNKNELLL